MMNNYQWSRQSIPRRMNTIFEVSRLLGLGRHQTLRRLKASGLPFRTYTRRWQDATGKWYSRKATGIPGPTAAELIKHDIVSELSQGWKSFAKAIKMKNPAPTPLLEELIQSIHNPLPKTVMKKPALLCWICRNCNRPHITKFRLSRDFPRRDRKAMERIVRK